REKGIMGDVYVTFTVSSIGKVKNVYIKKGVDKSLDDEAVRVIKNMPDWNPGLDEEGNPVDVEMSIPINFRLQ
ncbi:MAG: energy transducer TonB, partial [Bacteroidota bacterium]